MGRPMIYSEHGKVERLSMEVYRGYEFAVMNLGTHPCCYIKLPKGHKYENVDYDNIPTGYWIGWDYAHYGDYLVYDTTLWNGKVYSTEELEMDCRDAIDQLCELCGE